MEEVLLRSDTSKLEIEKQTIPYAWEDQGGLWIGLHRGIMGSGPLKGVSLAIIHVPHSRVSCWTFHHCGRGH